MKLIVQKENPILRTMAAALPLEDISSAKTKRLVAAMSEMLAAAPDGVALAAPQIGQSLRIFVVSKRLFRDGEDDAIFINPEIIKRSRKRVLLDEGCLSVRHIYGKAKRAEKATVRAYDLEGNQFTWNGSGLLAQVFQHEIDHLNGILFTDHATDLHEQKK